MPASDAGKQRAQDDGSAAISFLNKVAREPRSNRGHSSERGSSSHRTHQSAPKGHTSFYAKGTGDRKTLGPGAPEPTGELLEHGPTEPQSASQ